MALDLIGPAQAYGLPQRQADASLPCWKGRGAARSDAESASPGRTLALVGLGALAMLPAVGHSPSAPVATMLAVDPYASSRCWPSWAWRSVILQPSPTWTPSQFYGLLLIVALAACLAVSATTVLIYLGLEFLSITSYVLDRLHPQRRSVFPRNRLGGRSRPQMIVARRTTDLGTAPWHWRIILLLALQGDLVPKRHVGLVHHLKATGLRCFRPGPHTEGQWTAPRTSPSPPVLNIKRKPPSASPGRRTDPMPCGPPSRASKLTRSCYPSQCLWGRAPWWRLRQIYIKKWQRGRPVPFSGRIPPTARANSSCSAP